MGLTPPPPPPGEILKVPIFDRVFFIRIRNLDL